MQSYVGRNLRISVDLHLNSMVQSASSQYWKKCRDVKKHFINSGLMAKKLIKGSIITYLLNYLLFTIIYRFNFNVQMQ